MTASPSPKESRTSKPPNGRETLTPDPIAQLRSRIEEMDRELVQLLARRCQLAQAVGEQKRSNGLPMVDPAREASVVRSAAASARSQGLDAEGVRQILWCVIGLARQAQVDPRPHPSDCETP